jgi:alpha-glucosidase
MRRVPHERVRNLYGQQHARATHEGLLRRGDGRRPFVLTRSGYAGVQRHAAIWTGDTLSRWSHLHESVAMLLNLSLSGVALCGADIGGFARSCSPELYARWIQLGALYPFARTHSMGRRRQEPWRFGRRVEAIAREALRLRMRLLPYLYALCREAAETGAPLWRPLFFEFPDAPGCADVDDQLMLGDALLVAPILERGARERRVVLPPGPWYAFHDDACYRGPREIHVAAPLERIPLFVRGGSILPNRAPTLHVGAPCEEPLAFDLYPGGDALREWVEDDGETRAHEEGEVARTSLRLWSRAGGRLRFELGRRAGPFHVPERRLRVTLHGAAPPTRVLLDGVRLAEDAVPGYRVADGKVHVTLVDRGEGAALEIEPAP